MALSIKCDSLALRTESREERILVVLLLLLFSFSKSPGGHAIYRRNASMLEIQNFTPLLNINCKPHAVKEFPE